MEGGRVGGREGERKKGKVAVREGRREGGRATVREGSREGRMEGWRKSPVHGGNNLFMDRGNDLLRRK